jgi:hypothetical protein
MTEAEFTKAVAAGLRAFADDLIAGKPFALSCLRPDGEMLLPHEWAEYPHSDYRNF